MKNDFIPKIRFRGLWALAATSLILIQASADPLLPYSQPIATMLTNDIVILEATPHRTPQQNKELSTDKTALKTYHQTSTSLTADINILRSLDGYVGGRASYYPLVTNSIGDYTVDFQQRAASLQTTVLPAPLSHWKSDASTRLTGIITSLTRATLNGSRNTQLSALRTAAHDLVTASNQVYKALQAKTNGSAMSASIGRINFGSTTGTNHTVGVFSNGVFSISSVEKGPVNRTIDLYVSGISNSFPAAYPIGRNGNVAVYTAYDGDTRRTFIFDAIPGGISRPLSFVTIDAVTPTYVVGRFNFTGMLSSNTPPVGIDTNMITTITNGQFQLNF